MQAICHGDGEGVHGEADAQSCAVQIEKKIHRGYLLFGTWFRRSAGRMPKLERKARLNTE